MSSVLSIFIRQNSDQRDAGNFAVIDLRGTSYMDDSEIEDGQYNRVHWKQTLHHGLRLVARKRSIVKTKSKLPEYESARKAAARAYVTFYDCDGFKDIRRRASPHQRAAAKTNCSCTATGKRE